MNPTRRAGPWAAVVWVLVCLGAGAVGSLLMGTESRAWYRTLARPPLSPPEWVFGPVWTVLYVAMGLSAWLVWGRRPSPGRAAGLALFALQLLLNALWTPVFFGLQDPRGALMVLAALWLAVAATIVVFWRLSVAAGTLLVPYLAWVSFAAYLNYAIVALNR